MPTASAPGDLELVRQFVNTRDIETGTDELDDIDSWTDWAQRHGRESGAPTSESLRRAATLREALRAALLANHERAPVPPDVVAALNDAASWSGLRPEFNGSGVTLVSERDGLVGLVADVVAATAAALQDGTWTRLKACANDACQWGFYDRSRSRTGRWCLMGACGNRTKQARWRERHADHDG